MRKQRPQSWSNRLSSHWEVGEPGIHLRLGHRSAQGLRELRAARHQLVRSLGNRLERRAQPRIQVSSSCCFWDTCCQFSKLIGKAELNFLETTVKHWRFRFHRKRSDWWLPCPLVKQQDRPPSFRSVWLWLSEWSGSFSVPCWVALDSHRAWGYCGGNSPRLKLCLTRDSLCAWGPLTKDEGHFISGFSDVHWWFSLLRKLHWDSAPHDPPHPPAQPLATCFLGPVLLRTNVTYHDLVSRLCWVIEKCL